MRRRRTICTFAFGKSAPVDKRRRPPTAVGKSNSPKPWRGVLCAVCMIVLSARAHGQAATPTSEPAPDELYYYARGQKIFIAAVPSEYLVQLVSAADVQKAKAAGPQQAKESFELAPLDRLQQPRVIKNRSDYRVLNTNAALGAWQPGEGAAAPPADVRAILWRTPAFREKSKTSTFY
ncbi:MAG: hypothetical protein GX616_16705, partial [Planctomycetes bacterium]|nr:hypothetical protein [Planctomycetota bacterium]